MGTLIRLRLLRTAFVVFLLFWTIPLFAATTSGHVSWIYDGDTIKVEGVGKVRLIGIDTPESHASARDTYYLERYRIPAPRLRKIAAEALDFNIRHAKGKRVRLEFDQVKRDKFGRILAYVYLPDGTLLNRLLLAQGLASVFRRFDFQRKPEFIKIEAEARKAKTGLWKH